MHLLVTGGSGFIGSNFIRHMLESHPTISVTNLDVLTYAGNPANLRDIEDDSRYAFVQGDICDRAVVDGVLDQYHIDTVVHFAAESHVDRSIADGSVFVKTNVLGTFTMLDAALAHGIERFIHVSTDEVYGSTREGSFVETDNLNPSSPYSSTKAGSDLLALSYWHTHRLPVIVTRCTNNYGPFQYPEKLIPLFATNLMEGKKVPIYGTGENVRDWLFVTDHCRAIDFLLENGKPGEAYNIGGGEEKTNLEITHTILRALGKDESMIEYVEDRKGHDFRYSLDFSKLRRIGWEPAFPFDEAMTATVRWYGENEWWWRPLKEGAR
ncbi:dTDP-glucose 4,6-dehydratase [Methanogenium sp. S4BF]|uniref:dTDP-glucose 4,6-dehydratase n=1 Tax=Methanogenium sp. S4BF TaxID=1789226 RepID=UPI002416F3CA|nr:dTDP-glucose 4,6-dehydratase [Methanogenium sp. S4BF]WFN35338.1 dTDP-glucose 4,6-dehydratase [Methanogenium sp. S4BF]